MHLPEGLSVFWTRPNRAQIGIDARVGAHLDSLLPQEVNLVAALTTPLTETEYFQLARRMHVPLSRAKRLEAMLAAAGFLCTRPAHVPDAEVNARLRRPSPQARANAHVHIYRLDPLGVGIASALADAGIGIISTADTGTVTPHDHPLLAKEMLGMPRAQACASLLRARNPQVRLDADQLPDMAVVSGSYGVDPYISARFTELGVPVLHAWVEEVDVLIGPLTIAHRTPCATCVYQHQVDSNADWAVLGPQAFAARPLVPAVASRELACAIIAREILAEIDGYTSYLRTNLQVIPPIPELPSLHRIAPHPQCGCGAASAVSAASAAAGANVSPATAGTGASAAAVPSALSCQAPARAALPRAEN